MKIDKFSRRIEDNRVYKSDADHTKVEWVWNKDELAWCVYTFNGEVHIKRIRFTGEKWLSNGGFNLSSSYQIYQYVDISDPKSFSHNDCYSLFGDLEGVKSYCIDYWEKFLMQTQQTVEKNKKSIYEFTKQYDGGRPEKLKRILNETETNHKGQI